MCVYMGYSVSPGNLTVPNHRSELFTVGILRPNAACRLWDTCKGFSFSMTARRKFFKSHCIIFLSQWVRKGGGGTDQFRTGAKKQLE